MSSFSEEDDLSAFATYVSTRLPWRYCIRSKAARLILLWNFAVLLIYTALSLNIQLFQTLNLYGGSIMIGGGSIIAVFAPMAGLLTDLKYSRYKTVICSSYFLIFEITAFLLTTITFICMQLAERQQYRHSIDIILFLFAGIFLVTLLVFLINSLRFGMDQLHDSPTEDSILFIHWYVWIYYLSSLIVSIPWSLLAYYHQWIFTWREKKLTLSGVIIGLLICIIILSILVFSLCIIRYRNRWFLMEPPGPNPYKLVYRVLRFAYQHKVPLRRSAFTYCEDEFPSRLDLGKHKYGGPFTTKQVEDVKAFWGILKVISSMGPAFMIQTAAQAMLPVFARHSIIYQQKFTHNNVQEIHIEGATRHILISNGLLSHLLVVVCIPLYLCLIRPRISFQLPGMLKRVGLGIVLLIVSLAATLAMDVAVHALKSDTNCIFRGLTHLHGYDFCSNISNMSPPLYQNPYFFILQHFLAALTNMLIDIAVLEFILSQSPYSMKGLLLGYFFSIKSLFQAMTIASMFLFGRLWNVKTLSCGSGFYLMNIVIGVVELALYTIVAKRFKYRTVSEPSNEYRYAEDYYSNIQ